MLRFLILHRVYITCCGLQVLSSHLYICLWYMAITSLSFKPTAMRQYHKRLIYKVKYLNIHFWWCINHTLCYTKQLTSTRQLHLVKTTNFRNDISNKFYKLPTRAQASGGSGSLTISVTRGLATLRLLFWYGLQQLSQWVEVAGIDGVKWCRLMVQWLQFDEPVCSPCSDKVGEW